VSTDSTHEGPPPQHPAVNADGTLAHAAPDTTGLHPNAVRVAETLAGLGVAGEVRALPEPAPTAATAAAQLGVTVGAIANSLVFDADGEPLLVLTSGAHRADTALLAALIGAGEVRRATPEFVRSATGQPIGGVAPVGHPAPLRTIVDLELARHDVVWAAGGHPHYVFPTTYDELLRITAGEAAEVGERPV
jgi:prolyl-tRNA editing enzyme YbaK/EbsC (Cys-tRNA(Pro) deacylase)